MSETTEDIVKIASGLSKGDRFLLEYLYSCV